jgi:tetraacyldisaccharide 4'-kinase
VVSGKNDTTAALLLRAFLTLLSYPYSLVIRARNALYDGGALRSYKAAVPVISVGNITLGGTGKTPFVEWLCRYLAGKGAKPVILSRGYGRVRDETNDEFRLMAANLPGVGHLAGPDRVASARRAESELHADCIILDDGFSHRRLKRDLDILLLDVFKPFGYGRLFPGGLLREPIEAARRADMFVLTRCDLVEEDYLEDFEDKLKRFFPTKPIARAVHRPLKVREISSGDEHPPEWLADRSVYAFCGIGNPAAFRATIEKLGASVLNFNAYPDHASYDREDVSHIRAASAESGAEIILTTQKDGVKIGGFRNTAGMYELLIGLEIVGGIEELTERVDRASGKSSA